jgi:hypothetical protein
MKIRTDAYKRAARASGLALEEVQKRCPSLKGA